MQATPGAWGIDQRAHPPPDFMVCSPLEAPPSSLAEGKALVAGVELSILTEPPNGPSTSHQVFSGKSRLQAHLAMCVRHFAWIQPSPDPSARRDCCHQAIHAPNAQVAEPYC